MRFNSFVFWVFLAVVATILWSLPQRARKPWLLIASYAFYGLWHYVYLALMIGVALTASVGGGYVLDAPDAQKKRRATWVIAFLLLILGAFKYLEWAVTNVNGLALLLGTRATLPVPHWVLPLGISFYVFEAVSYILECMRKKERKYSFWDFQLFVAFFPHLIAGPIMRAKELIPQFEPSKWRLRSSQVLDGIWLIGSGLFLKIMMADNMATPVDAFFSRDPRAFNSMDVLFLAVGFGLQIYFDFSAYSRLAIGAARLCGVNLVENFNFPFSARTPADFWNRWHMSLSRWIRDYLFFPLVGKRLTVGAMCKATIIAMTLCGIWHGAGWTFIFWGLYHGLLIAAYYVARSIVRPQTEDGPPAPNFFDTRMGGLLGGGLTWLLLVPSWILFRSADLGQAARLLHTLLTPWVRAPRALGGRFILEVAVLMTATWLAPFAVARVAALRARAAAALGRHGDVVLGAARGLVVGAMLASAILYLDAQTSFIYFQF